MEIEVNGEIFHLDDRSEVEVDVYDLKITEPYFDVSTSKIEKGRFVNKQIKLPGWIESKVCRTWLLPSSGLYKDANGKRRFEAYFD